MRHLPVSLKLFSLVILVTLLSGLTLASASAGPVVTQPEWFRCKPLQNKPAVTDNQSATEAIDYIPCCFTKVVPHSLDGKTDIQSVGCCFPPGKQIIGRTFEGGLPCTPPVTGCQLALPDGAVVGNLPFDTQAYWKAGKSAIGVMVNAGTYYVTGVATAENGDKYYQIVLGCQLLYVPLGTMQPSFEPPWNGEPLPTTEVS